MLLLLLTITDPDNYSRIAYIYDNFHNGMIVIARNKLKTMGDTNYAYDAEDVVQNSFLKITKYIDDINAETDPKVLKAYIFAIVTNEAINFISHSKYYESIDDLPDVPEDDEFIAGLQIESRYERVVRIIKGMDDIYGLTLLLRFQKNMSVGDISEFTGLPEKTIYTRLARGKKMLLEQLKTEEKTNG